jgi:serine/threonine protein phosphatase PrpC
VIPQTHHETSLAVGHRFDPVAVAYVAGKGRRPEENQDSYWPRAAAAGLRPVVDYLAIGRLYVVADGVSQGLRPQDAGRLAAEMIGETYYRLTTGWSSGRDVTDALRQAVYAGHQILVEASQQARTSSGVVELSAYLQAACVCLLLVGDRYYTAHVGDSRAYLWRDGALYPLTEDHVDAEGRVNRLLGADLTPERVTVGTGVASGLEPLRPGDRLLLCSDGVHRFLSNSRIGQILDRREGLAGTADGLVEAVHERALGKEDDISVILVGLDYSPRQLLEAERQSTTHRLAGQWRDAIALAEEIVWWQPGFGAPQRPILRSLADLYVEAARAAFARDEALALKMLKNAARIGSAQGARYHALAMRYLDGVSRWRAQRGTERLLPEQQRIVAGLIASSEQAVELFGPQAITTACNAALDLTAELQRVGQGRAALSFADWVMQHSADNPDRRREANAIATAARESLRGEQAVHLRKIPEAHQQGNEMDPKTASRSDGEEVAPLRERTGSPAFRVGGSKPPEPGNGAGRLVSQTLPIVRAIHPEPLPQIPAEAPMPSATPAPITSHKESRVKLEAHMVIPIAVPVFLLLVILVIALTKVGQAPAPGWMTDSVAQIRYAGAGAGVASPTPASILTQMVSRNRATITATLTPVVVQALPTVLPTVEPRSPMSSPAIAALSPTASGSATPDLSPAPASPALQVKAIVNVERLNVRSRPDTGPGSVVLGTVTKGQVYDVTGRNRVGDWWQVCCIQVDRKGWVVAEFVTVTGARETVPIIGE